MRQERAAVRLQKSERGRQARVRRKKRGKMLRKRKNSNRE